MTQTQKYADLDTTSVTAALTLAVRAPSIHNTQPWRWELRHGVLTLMVDRARQLLVADPDGHSMLMSCGAALALTEMGLRAEGWDVEVDRPSDPGDPDVLAEFRGLGRRAPAQHDLDRAAAGRRRQSERRPFAVGRVAPDDIEKLRVIAAAPGVFVHFPVRDDENLDLAIAVSHADRFERNDADYLAEMRRWVRSDDESNDGVPAMAIPHVPGAEPRHTNVPVRDFEVGIPGGQLIAAGIDERPLIAVVFTTADGRADQLAAGEAMMRLLIEAELLGLSCCPISQAVDMLAFRTRLRVLMSWTEYPQMMLRLGNPPEAGRAPLTRRRPVADVLQIVA
jgi:nitroreductase